MCGVVVSFSSILVPASNNTLNIILPVYNTTSISLNKSHVYFKMNFDQKIKEENIDYIIRN
jgi:hypothetical protein